MKPQEKAIELFELFYLANKDSLDVLKIKSKAISKTNAIVCANEIMKCCSFLDHTKKKYFSECADLSDSQFSTYWEEVKSELEKL